MWFYCHHTLQKDALYIIENKSVAPMSKDAVSVVVVYKSIVIFGIPEECFDLVPRLEVDLDTQTQPLGFEC